MAINENKQLVFPFQIFNCFFQIINRIFEIAQTAIAKMAKQSANFARFMAMVNGKRFFGSIRRLANKANAALPFKQIFVLFGRNSIKPFSRPISILFSRIAVAFITAQFGFSFRRRNYFLVGFPPQWTFSFAVFGFIVFPIGFGFLCLRIFFRVFAVTIPAIMMQSIFAKGVSRKFRNWFNFFTTGTFFSFHNLLTE